jgi:sec-independent protein translocase protein TatB
MSFSETIFLFLLALVIFGPKKLPEIARQAGRLLGELRRASNEFKSQIEQEIAHLEIEKTQTILPPSQPPQGTLAARSLSASTPVIEPASQATLAGPTDEARANPTTEVNATTEGSAPSPAPTGSIAPAEPLPAPTSQEFHA